MTFPPLFETPASKGQTAQGLKVSSSNNTRNPSTEHQYHAFGEQVPVPTHPGASTMKENDDTSKCKQKSAPKAEYIGFPPSPPSRTPVEVLISSDQDKDVSPISAYTTPTRIPTSTRIPNATSIRHNSTNDLHESRSRGGLRESRSQNDLGESPTLKQQGTRQRIEPQRPKQKQEHPDYSRRSDYDFERRPDYDYEQRPDYEQGSDYNYERRHDY